MFIQAIKSHPGFSSPPMGPVGDCIVCDKLCGLIPWSFATSYLVHSEEDVCILRELVAAYGETHPTVILNRIQLDNFKL